MLGLITDRTQRNVYRRKELLNKGWAGMTTEERTEWEGNPLVATGANLFSTTQAIPDGAELKYWNQEMVATAIVEGVYLYGISIIGKAADFENKTLTLSASSITSSTGGTPKIEIFWYDSVGIEWAGGTLLSAGSVTFDTAQTPNISGREYLAAYVYVTTDENVKVGDTATFGKVMLEYGSVKHEYTPYTEIFPTMATKGAYNYSDLNRVERMVKEISERAGLNLTTKINWAMWDLPTETDMSRYLGNVNAIKTHFGINIALPTSMNNFTYEYANNIELILSRAYESLAK